MIDIKSSLETKSETPSFDVVIVGGGPAGTATALSLRKHDPSLSVAIVEGSAYETPRIGETLSPIARPLLEHLGVWQQFTTQKHLSSYGTHSAWGSDELLANEFIYQPHNRGWHLDRRHFDSLLACEAVQRGVALFTDSTVLNSREGRGGNWQLTVRNGHKQDVTINGGFVVDGSGRRAVFARQRGIAKQVLDRLLAVFVSFETDDAFSSDTHMLVEACEEGWWYSASIPDSRIVVACMSDADIVKKNRLRSSRQWFECLAKTRHVARMVRHATAVSGPSVYAAYSHRLARFSGNRWIAVGDAATTFDPLSSHGIFKALRSGILASYAIVDYFKGITSGIEKYEAILSREYLEYVDTRYEYYEKERRWRDLPFWRRRRLAEHEPEDRGSATKTRRHEAAPGL